MTYFILVFIIMNILIFSLDRYFYLTISKVLEFKAINSMESLKSLGYYNKSIFTNRIYGVIISLLISILVVGIYFYIKNKDRKRYVSKINELERDLIKINTGDYSIDIKEEDEFSILRDEIYKVIVSLKSLEEEAKKQKIILKKDLSNIAHQLKTPITSIGFMAELIAEDRDNMDIYLEKLYGELEKLRNFTEILLKLSRVNAKAVEYNLIEISIKEIIEDILARLNRNKALEVRYIGSDFNIVADEVWIYEAFLNIIKNSMEHTRDSIEIEFESNPIYKLIRISDNGSGVDDDVLNRIFDRFYRGDTSLPGYGIGLNLSKSIIEDHSGTIVAFNNDGLTFEIQFYNVT